MDKEAIIDQQVKLSCIPLFFDGVGNQIHECMFHYTLTHTHTHTHTYTHTHTHAYTPVPGRKQLEECRREVRLCKERASELEAKYTGALDELAQCQVELASFKELSTLQVNKQPLRLSLSTGHSSLDSSRMLQGGAWKTNSKVSSRGTWSH